MPATADADRRPEGVRAARASRAAADDALRRLLSRWCGDRLPAGVRPQVQISYTILEGVVTIVERRPPAFPPLGAAWTATPVAQLRRDDPVAGAWSLYEPTDRGWRRYRRPLAQAVEPAPLLAEVDADPTGVFWG